MIPSFLRCLVTSSSLMRSTHAIWVSEYPTVFSSLKKSSGMSSATLYRMSFSSYFTKRLICLIYHGSILVSLCTVFSGTPSLRASFTRYILSSLTFSSRARMSSVWIHSFISAPRPARLFSWL